MFGKVGQALICKTVDHFNVKPNLHKTRPMFTIQRTYYSAANKS